MLEMDLEEILISLVQKHECLYNIHKYTGRLAKQKAWERISNELGMPVDECINKWKRLRNNFRKAVKIREDDNGPEWRPCKYEKELEFLKPNLHARSQGTNVKHYPSTQNLPSKRIKEATANSLNIRDIDSNPTELPIYQRTIQPNSSTKTNGISEILQNYIESITKEEKHPIDAFFSAMAVNVKKLPLMLQLEVKNKVYNAVSDAELKYLNESALVGVNFDDHCTTSNTPLSPSYQTPHSPSTISLDHEVKLEYDEQDSDSIIN